jgi:HSP20 family protein
MSIKRSFFDRLSGSAAGGNDFDSFDEELPTQATSKNVLDRTKLHSRPAPLEDSSSAAEGQLPVDVLQTPSEIIIRAFVAGVRPDELNISINRDLVEIAGSRVERDQSSGPDFFTRELFWGSFARSILLPQEVDVEAASANAKDGLLTIILPKLDKAKQTKLRVKSG